MKILLTGSRGNLGQALLRSGSPAQFLTLDRDEWDQLDKKLESVETVIHAAADLRTSIAREPSAVLEANVMTTAHLLEAMAKQPKARLVFISSCAVYGQSQVTAEHSTPSPISLNGLTKFVNEKMIAEFCTHKKIEFQILRLFNTFGGNDRFSILSHLKRAIQENKAFTLFNGGVSQRDFIHVDDAAALILKLIALPAKEKVMNLGSGETTRIADILAHVLAKYPKLEVLHRELPEAEYSRADITRLREAVSDFQFRRVLDFIREEF